MPRRKSRAPRNCSRCSRCASHASQTLRRSAACSFGLFQSSPQVASSRQPRALQTSSPIWSAGTGRRGHVMVPGSSVRSARRRRSRAAGSTGGSISAALAAARPAFARITATYGSTTAPTSRTPESHARMRPQVMTAVRKQHRADAHLDQVPPGAPREVVGERLPGSRDPGHLARSGAGLAHHRSLAAAVRAAGRSGALSGVRSVGIGQRVLPDRVRRVPATAAARPDTVGLRDRGRTRSAGPQRPRERG